MLDCPKCGFRQPADRYCANCGVDMSRVQKKQISLLRRILSHWSLQLICLSFLIGSLALFIRNRRTDDASKVQEKVTIAGSLASKPVALKPTPAISPQKKLPIQTQTTVQSIESSAPEVTQEIDEAQLLLRFATIQGTTYQAFFNKIEETPRDYVTFISNDLKYWRNFLVAQKGATTLLSKSVTLQANGEHLAFFGSEDSDGNNSQGLYLFFVPEKISAKEMRLRIRIGRAFRDDNDQIQEQIEELVHELSKNQILLISGLLPQPPPALTEEDVDSLPSSMEIMDSQDYRDGKADFFVILEWKPTPRNKNPQPSREKP